MRQVGHGGTLDPLASGLLPVLVGTATKFEPRMREATKVYDAVVRFGRETATDDREGESVRQTPASPLRLSLLVWRKTRIVHLPSQNTWKRKKKEMLVRTSNNYLALVLFHITKVTSEPGLLSKSFGRSLSA